MDGVRANRSDTAVPLDRPVYQVNEAARLLRLPDKTLRRWLDGDRRFETVIEPLIRPEPTGSTEVTWGEFVEAGFLREYRIRRLPIERLRPLIGSLREKLGTLYPLAHAKPLYAAGRKLLWREQTDHQLDPDLFLVVQDSLHQGYQLVLSDVASSFVSRVDFEPPETGVVARWYPQAPDRRRIVLDPRIAFGLPNINGVRTEVLAELSWAGESATRIVEIYRGFHVEPEDVAEAVAFEASIKQAA